MTERVLPEGWSFFSDLKPGDKVYRENYVAHADASVFTELEVLGAGKDGSDVLGRTFPSIRVLTPDGMEGSLMYGPEGMIRTELPS